MPNKPKLLFVITSLAIGGAETQSFNLVKSIKDKFDIYLVGFKNGPNLQKFQKIGIKVELVEIKNQWQFVKAYRYIKKIIKEFEPDIVQSFLPHANIVCKLAGRKTNSKIITGIRNSKNSTLLQYLEKYTQKYADLSITNSNVTKKLLVKQGFDDDQIKVIYNGIDFREPKQKYEYKHKTILTVARFKSQKDYTTNVLTAQELLKYRQDFKFIYVGDGPQLAEIKDMVQELGLSSYIEFWGNSDKIPELMSSVDVFFLPTLYEGQANVILEAMYYELPIITTHIPENKEICDAFWANIGDYEKFAKLIDNVLNTKPKQIIQSNKQKVQEFTIQNMSNNYCKTYKNFLQK